MRASVRWEGKMAFRGAAGSGHEVLVDAAPAVGGEDRGPRPMELVLLALGGCTAMDVISILNRMRQPVAGMEVALEADRANEHPKVFTAIRVVFRLDGEGLELAKAERAIRLSAERYCSVGNMLKQAAPIEIAYEVNGARFRLGDNPGTGDAGPDHT